MQDSTAKLSNILKTKGFKMDKFLEIFYEICKIPHPSKNTRELKEFIIDFGLKNKCSVKTDSFGNIHLLKGNPKICFQAHYDMVLIGDRVEPIIKNNMLCSKDSSLGADNGAALAAILGFSQSLENFEALITNDEEIGMIGANNLKLNIESKEILNLDSEDINQIVVGCAGGFDADIALKPKFKICILPHFYEITSRNFKGGHSGIDINKNIKNAIVELLWFVDNFPCEIVEFSGGEKRNSIPVNAKAIIATKKPLKIENNNNFEIKSINKVYKKSFSKNILKPILALHNGVYNIDKDNVLSSLSISLLSNESLKIMVRANRKVLMDRIIKNLKFQFKNIEISGIYMPWEVSKDNESKLLKKVENVYKKYNKNYEIIEIHAGLECGILKSKCEDIISIGPTILNPHSKLECMDLKSYDTFLKILKELV